MIPRIHALCDAFSKLNGALDPQSPAYKFRNPLLLKAFLPKHEKDEATGYRTFRSLTSGYDNGINDLKIKCSGRSYHKIGPQSTLTDLVVLYGNPVTATKYVVNFLRHALNDDNITGNYPLSWFLEAESMNEVSNA